MTTWPTGNGNEKRTSRMRATTTEREPIAAVSDAARRMTFPRPVVFPVPCFDLAGETTWLFPLSLFHTPNIHLLFAKTTANTKTTEEKACANSNHSWFQVIYRVYCNR